MAGQPAVPAAPGGRGDAAAAVRRPGRPEDLLAAIHTLRAWALEQAPAGLAQVRGYLADGGPFPQRLHISALFARFYTDVLERMIDWADLAEAQVAAWPRTADLGMTPPTRALLQELQARLEALTGRLTADPPDDSGTQTAPGD